MNVCNVTKRRTYREHSPGQSLVPVVQDDVEAVVVPCAVSKGGVVVEYLGIGDDDADFLVAYERAGQHLQTSQTPHVHEIC